MVPILTIYIISVIILESNFLQIQVITKDQPRIFRVLTGSRHSTAHTMGKIRLRSLLTPEHFLERQRISAEVQVTDGARTVLSCPSLRGDQAPRSGLLREGYVWVSIAYATASMHSIWGFGRKRSEIASKTCGIPLRPNQARGFKDKDKTHKMQKYRGQYP